MSVTNGQALRAGLPPPFPAQHGLGDASGAVSFPSTFIPFTGWTRYGYWDEGGRLFSATNGHEIYPIRKLL